MALVLWLPPTPAGTRLTLRHTGLPTQEAKDAHQSGFRLYLSLLAACAAEAEHRERLPRVVEAWFAAWNAEDPGDRAAALERCLADDGEFRDAWAMPGIALEPSGAPDLTHGYARFRWEAVGPAGPAASGENFGVLDGDGRFRLVAGFRDAGSV